MANFSKIREHSVSRPITYRFVFESPHSWACFTVNDATCELLMTSDYGSYAHRWPDAFGGQTLTEFLAGKGRAHARTAAVKRLERMGYTVEKA